MRGLDAAGERGTWFTRLFRRPDVSDPVKVAEQIVGIRTAEPREKIIARYTAAVQSIVDQNPAGAPLVVSVREVGLMDIHVNEDGRVTLTPRPSASL